MLSTVKPGTNVENKAQTTQPDTTLHMSKQFSNHWLKPGVEPPLKSFRNTGGQSDFTWVWKDRYYKILCRVPFHRIRLKLHEIMLKLDHNVPSSPCWGHTSFFIGPSQAWRHALAVNAWTTETNNWVVIGLTSEYPAFSKWSFLFVNSWNTGTTRRIIKSSD